MGSNFGFKKSLGSNFSSVGIRFFLKILPSDSAERMSAAVEAPAPEGQLHCKLCGLVYSGEARRLQYNSFVCTPCANIDRNIRRNLGDRDGLPILGPARINSTSFGKFGKAKKARGSTGRPSKLPS